MSLQIEGTREADTVYRITYSIRETSASKMMSGILNKYLDANSQLCADECSRFWEMWYKWMLCILTYLSCARIDHL